MLFALHLAAFYLAFCCKTHCVQRQIALHFAAKYLAFSGKTHCVQHQIALHLAANSPKTGTNGGSLEYKFILPHLQTNPCLHQKQPSRESIFCGKVGNWWQKRVLIMLKFVLKNGHLLANWWIDGWPFNRINGLSSRLVAGGQADGCSPFSAFLVGELTSQPVCGVDQWVGLPDEGQANLVDYANVQQICRFPISSLSFAKCKKWDNDFRFRNKMTIFAYCLAVAEVADDNSCWHKWRAKAEKTVIQERFWRA